MTAAAVVNAVAKSIARNPNLASIAAAGTWKHFNFKPIESTDYNKVLQHLQDHFLTDLAKQTAKCATTGELAKSTVDYYVEYVMDTLKLQEKHGRLSFIAVDSSTNKVAGMRLSTVHDAQTVPEYSKALQSFKFTNELATLSHINAQLHKSADLFQSYPNLKQVVTSVGASIAPEYKGQGLYSQMLNRNIELAKENGHEAIQSIFTNPTTRNLATELGFVELARIYQRDCFDTNGSLYFAQFRNLGKNNDENAFYSLMVKFL